MRVTVTALWPRTIISQGPDCSSKASNGRDNNFSSLENDQDCLITSQGLAFSLPKTKVHVNVPKMNLR